ncbi:ML domain-containing protein [Lasiosphaeria miniovina]|uniref:Phosphatidylglycerol/phosphatidylinositol transfer protein n=2 Tax=Lasiosphaeria TaxID=92901 RepID=A0AA40ALQ4_9PEZI|nr:ML domain-containing protein [Lasiosphaeria miniovina]KAK0718139.1 ML domain-containing protein [Lasiosphaeria miniovina]KAK3368931.1 ML domain-containing protein [Lasiosphaeria ovina]
MRLSAAFALLSVGASALSIFSDDKQHAIAADDDLDVPGQSPLKFCEGDRSNDLITIDSVILTPNPPEAGQTLVIEATGTVKETIEEGAYVNLQVKYGYIRLINTQADLCTEIKNVDLECPIEKGKISIIKTVELPKEIPPGKYVVDADVYTADDERITCLTAKVDFARKSSFFDL